MHEECDFVCMAKLLVKMIKKLMELPRRREHVIAVDKMVTGLVLVKVRAVQVTTSSFALWHTWTAILLASCTKLHIGS